MKEAFGLSLTALDILRKALGGFAEIEDARIFGSRAMGNYRTGSDIDLAIYGPRVDEATVRRLSVLLNEESPLPYHVDVVAFERCENAALKEHILRYAKPLANERSDRDGVDHARESGYEALLRELVLSAVADMSCEVFLFGSRARGAPGRASDFDIGIRGLSEREFASAKRRIEDEAEDGPIPHDVDIVDFDRASEPFRSAALEDRIIWKSV